MGKQHLLCPECGEKLHYIAFYVGSKKYIAYADGTTGRRVIETEKMAPTDEGYYFCDGCGIEFKYVGDGKVEKTRLRMRANG